MYLSTIFKITIEDICNRNYHEFMKEIYLGLMTLIYSSKYSLWSVLVLKGKGSSSNVPNSSSSSRNRAWVPIPLLAFFNIHYVWLTLRWYILRYVFMSRWCSRLRRKTVGFISQKGAWVQSHSRQCYGIHS